MTDLPYRSRQAHLLFPREAAERLGVSMSTLAKWRVSGRGPAFVKFPHAVRYSVTALDEFSRSHEVLSTAQGFALKAQSALAEGEK